MERIVPPSGLLANGYMVPPKTVVSVPQYLAHRDPEVYGDDVEIFRAERWLESDTEKRSRMERNFLAASHVPFLESHGMFDSCTVWAWNASMCGARACNFGDQDASRQRVQAA